LGETYYVRGKYDVAARLFAEGYQQYPDGSKTADNLLKLGMALGALGKKEDACIALAQLDKETGANLASVQRRAEQEKTRLGC
jgi:TolA-binding protein